jgi:siroheme synthase-like protein
VDDARRSDLVFGSVLRRGDLQIAVSTGGRSPGLARLVRERLEGLFGPEWEELVCRVGEERTRARAAATTGDERVHAGFEVARRALAARGWTLRMAEDAGPQ